MADRFPVLRILLAGHLLVPLGALLVALSLNSLLALLLFAGMGSEKIMLGLLLLTGGVALVAGIVGASRLRGQLLKPLVELEHSVAEVCEGKPWSNFPLKTVGVLGPMTRDLDSLSGELIDLYEDMDNRVARQTRRLAQQATSLKVLYDVAASITQVNEIEELLLRMLQVVKELVGGKGATARLQSTNGQMQLVGSIGLDGRLLAEKEQLPVPLCACGKTLSSGDILCDHDAGACSRLNNRRMFSRDELDTLTVLLRFHGDTLGTFQVHLPQPGLTGRDDLVDLLSTIGNHLGIAIAKQRSDEEAHRLSIVEERTALANELHDSLAQTLASLRFQVRMLEETLEQCGASEGARSELNRIRNGLDEAHTELRELLNSFRAPVDKRGLEPALDKLVQRFRQETGIPIFFQSSCRQVNLGPSEEMQMLRIVQECLANIRKHSHARMVRVLLTCNSEDGYMLLVEDDGVGFDDASPDGKPGEHIGLSIMEERARRLGGSIRIESEPGEGTRIELTYNRHSESP